MLTATVASMQVGHRGRPCTTRSPRRVYSFTPGQPGPWPYTSRPLPVPPHVVWHAVESRLATRLSVLSERLSVPGAAPTAGQLQRGMFPEVMKKSSSPLGGIT